MVLAGMNDHLFLLIPTLRNHSGRSLPKSQPSPVMSHFLIHPCHTAGIANAISVLEFQLPNKLLMIMLSLLFFIRLI